MILPEAFTFNQANLQDFVDCKYRFYLRHLLKLEWPAVQTEPVQMQEARMELGYRYHLLIQQYFSGIDSSMISAGIQEPELNTWWDNFQKLRIMERSGEKYAEKLISVPFFGFRLSAKYDLLVYSESPIVMIYDWKTSTVLPRQKTLLDRMQTKVYPLILATNSIPPDHIEMVYWYPAFPESPVKFMYSQSQFIADQEILMNLVQQISGMAENHFDKTSNQRFCKYCRYRSLCERGETAGELSGTDDFEDWAENLLNFDFNLF